MSKEPNLVRGVNMARSLVYRQQHHGRHEQDRIDAKKWMEEFGRPVDPPRYHHLSSVRTVQEK